MSPYQVLFQSEFSERNISSRTVIFSTRKQAVNAAIKFCLNNSTCLRFATVDRIGRCSLGKYWAAYDNFDAFYRLTSTK